MVKSHETAVRLYPFFVPNTSLKKLLVMGVSGGLCAIGGIAVAATVSSTPSTAPSFDGPVYAIAHRGDTVYVGGSFGKAIVGGKSVARTRLAAFNAKTGALTSWNPGADNTVRALAVADTTVYAAGDFTQVAGATRKAIAGLDATSGAVTSFKHAITGQPNALTVGNGRLYVGGRITKVDTSVRTNLAAFTLSSGALNTTWAPTADDTVLALGFYGTRVYLGGSFHKTNGVSSTLRLSAVNATTGVLDKTFVTKPAAAVYAVAVDATGVYAALGGGGGRAVAYTDKGVVRWMRAFDGDAQAITTMDGTVYVGGHFDKACTTVETGTQGACTGGSVDRVKLAAIDQQGNLTAWAPQANGVVGVRALTAAPALSMVSAGGDFTTIGGVTQKRYAAFEPSTVIPPAPSSPVVASYNFDSNDADGTYDDGSGAGHLLRTLTSNGARLRTVAHGTGSAVVFPSVCTGTGCPKMVLQADSAADLNPGAGPIRWGASVLVRAGETTDGQNVLQKGYSTGGGQYKLQVDQTPGKPSCAMTGTTTVYLAKSAITVADGRWHTLECRRAGTTLTVLVDGVVQGTKVIPATLSVSNSSPLVLGGKGLSENNDQFQGALDDAWVSKI